MLAQTEEQKQNLSIEIEALLITALKPVISYNMNKFGPLLERKLGLAPEDLLNDIREQVWKGLITWKAGLANKKTYLNNLIEKRFLTLLRRSTLKKHNSLDYYASPQNLETVAEQDSVVTTETGETLYERRQEMMNDLKALTGEERTVYQDLLRGCGIADMVAKHAMPRVQVVKIINSISARLSERRENTRKGAL